MAQLVAALACLACFISWRASNAQGSPDQPPNSYAQGTNWYCYDGYRKQGNRCVNIFSKGAD